MTFKRFRAKDIVMNTIVTKPEINFLVSNGKVHYQFERSQAGNFSNNVKHIPSGHISLLESNINRPSDSLIYPFIEKSSTRYAWKTISTSRFDDNAQFLYGDTLTGSYPDSATLSRIYIPSGQEFSTDVGTATEVSAHGNKKYIRALKNSINSQENLGYGISYGDLGTKAANLICVPGIFYGSQIARGTIELEHYVTGTLTSKATDKFSDGRLIQVSGAADYNDKQVGLAVYNQGMLVLTGSWDLHAHSPENFLAPSSSSTPKWINFGTGTPQVGTQLAHVSPTGSTYLVKFKGVNKIPTITMYAYSQMAEDNFSSNPTFTTTVSSTVDNVRTDAYHETPQNIASINKSPYADHEEHFENTTYISKIGIYDKHKNLIAIASLANPVRKTEKRDFLFKIGLDF